jgi:hypothetical protein
MRANGILSSCFRTMKTIASLFCNPLPRSRENGHDSNRDHERFGSGFMIANAWMRWLQGKKSLRKLRVVKKPYLDE